MSFICLNVFPGAVRLVPNWKSAFTLLELFVVIGVIGFLAALLFPVFHSACRRAQRMECASNLCQLVIWYSLYLEDDEAESEPPVRLARCPSNRDPKFDSYHVPGYEDVPELTREWMLADKKPFHNGHNVAFRDGHVEFQRTNQFRLFGPTITVGASE
ncbi:MAG: type II secretion system protein [Verrucomicrobia bacterium]|nr:type II secretion system protein [Verrucomicrobiota bacterium]